MFTGQVIVQGAAMTAFHYGPDNPDNTYVAHSYPENTIDLGEVVMNYAAVGDPVLPALLLIPGIALLVIGLAIGPRVLWEVGLAVLLIGGGPAVISGTLLASECAIAAPP